MYQKHASRVWTSRPQYMWGHYDDVRMGAIASQITSLTIVYSNFYSDADQRKHQSSASLAFVWGIHRDRWIPHTKGQLRGKCFHLMTSSWCIYFSMPLIIASGSQFLNYSHFYTTYWDTLQIPASFHTFILQTITSNALKWVNWVYFDWNFTEICSQGCN